MNFKKLQAYQAQKLAMIYSELAYEKDIEKANKSIPEKIADLEKNTQLKLVTIKVGMLNTDFSYKEVCKFI